MSSNREIINWMKSELEQFIPDPAVQIQTYRVETNRLEQDNRWKFRLGLYAAGDNVDSTVPGMTPRGGVRLEGGFPDSTVQRYNIDISGYVAERRDDGEEVELEMEEISYRIERWTRKISNEVYSRSDGRLLLLIYASSTLPIRQTKYSTKTVTLIGLRNLLREPGVFDNSFDGTFQ